MVPYLDDVLRKTGRIKTQFFRDHEDSAQSGEVESQPYEEGARRERVLVGDILREHRRDAIMTDQIPMIGVCSVGTLLSAVGWQAWIGLQWWLGQGHIQSRIVAPK